MEILAVKNKWRGGQFYHYYDWFKSLARDGYCSCVVYEFKEYRIYNASKELKGKLKEFGIEYTERNYLFEGY